MSTIDVKSEISGRVFDIVAQIGQRLEEDDPIIVLEAMKMETMLSAERDATIHAIHVRAGETINARDLLIELKD